MASAEDFFTSEDKVLIQQTIAAAESKSTGEIRVRIEEKCSGDPVKRAETCFGILKMQETAERNGILFYLATDSKVFAVFGDKGIHEKVSDAFWNQITAQMTGHFRAGAFTKGLCEGIQSAGEQLAAYFPVKGKNPNELTNEISFE